jgi:putative MATE family efflux protein
VTPLDDDLPVTPDNPPAPLQTRHAGLSLAAFPAWLYNFLPVRVQQRLVEGSVTRRVLTLAWPSVLEQSLVTLIGLVDAYIVGHLGAAAIAGVGLGGQVLNLTAALFGAVGVGATALIARSIGAREPEEANQLARQALLLSFVIGLAAALLSFGLAPQIMETLGAAPEVVRDGAAWLRTVAPSFAFIGVLLVGNAALRGVGDTRSPLAVMVFVNLVNVSVAWTFTRGLFGLPNLGVVGSGLGAMSGQIIGGALVLGMLARGRGPLRLGLSLPRPDLARIKRLLNIGLPAGAEQVLLQVALLNLAAIISQFGTAAYAAHSIGLRIAALSFLPGWGFSVAATTLVGQELGARRPERARQATYVAFALALAVMTVMGVLLFVFEAHILRVFADDAAVLAAGAIVIRTSAVQQPLLAASFVFSGALRGAGDTRATMLITLTSIWGLRLVAAYVLGIVLGLGLFGAWLAVGLDFAVRSTLFYLRFRGGKWTTLRV